MKIVKRLSVKLSFIICLGLLFGACCSEDRAEISEFRVCDSDSEILCESNKSVFSQNDPLIHASAKLECVDAERTATFTLFFNLDGTKIEVAQASANLSDAEEDSNVFNVAGNFGLPENFIWDPGEWEVTLDVNSSEPLNAVKKFTVE